MKDEYEWLREDLNRAANFEPMPTKPASFYVGLIKEMFLGRYAVKAIFMLEAERAKVKCLSEIIDSQKQTHDALVKRCRELENENHALKLHAAKPFYIVNEDGKAVIESVAMHDMKARIKELEEAALQRIVEVGELQTALERIDKLEAQNKRMMDVIKHALEAVKKYPDHPMAASEVFFRQLLVGTEES